MDRNGPCNKSLVRIFRLLLPSIILIVSSRAQKPAVVAEGSQRYLLKDYENNDMQRNIKRQMQDGYGDSEGEFSNQSRDIYRPQRLRISPFDLFMSPTTVQLTRVDEDILLLKLQDLLTIFIEASQSANGRALDYVLFSDVQRNSWIHNELEPSQSILHLNGGVASFMGNNVPTERQINEWVEQVVNTLLVPSLNDTRYSYLSKTMYLSVGQEVQRPNVAATPEGIQQPLTPSPITDGSQNLVPLLCASIAIGVLLMLILATFFRRRSDKIHDNPKHFFKDDSAIIEAATSPDAEEIHFSSDPSTLQDPNDHHPEDMSLYSTASASQSEWTLPSFSTARMSRDGSSMASSFNPRALRKPPMIMTESFQKERQANIQKDMMYSTWSGVAPNILKSNRGESVLKPSHFTAAQARTREQDGVENNNADISKKKNEQVVRMDVVDDDGTPFVFEQAHERV